MDSLFKGISKEDLVTTQMVLDQLYQNLDVIAQDISKQGKNGDMPSIHTATWVYR